MNCSYFGQRLCSVTREVNKKLGSIVQGVNRRGRRHVSKQKSLKKCLWCFNTSQAFYKHCSLQIHRHTSFIFTTQTWKLASVFSSNSQTDFPNRQASPFIKGCRLFNQVCRRRNGRSCDTKVSLQFSDSISAEAVIKHSAKV